MSTIFQKIIDREIPAEIVYEDDRAIAFKDINPQAPVHLLLIPRQPITGVSGAGDADTEILGHLLQVARTIAVRDGIEGFRLVINDGADAGQEVFHLHVHMLAGRGFRWPPG